MLQNWGNESYLIPAHHQPNSQKLMESIWLTEQKSLISDMSNEWQTTQTQENIG